LGKKKKTNELSLFPTRKKKKDRCFVTDRQWEFESRKKEKNTVMDLPRQREEKKGKAT